MQSEAKNKRFGKPYITKVFRLNWNYIKA